MESFVKYFYAGQKVENGIYACVNCGQKTLVQNEVLNRCLKCGLNRFTLYKVLKIF